MDKGVGIEDADGAISSGREEVAGKGKGGWGEEGKRGNRRGVLVEGAKGGGGRNVVYVNGIVGRAGCSGRAGGGYCGDGGEVGRVGEKWG